ncbi:MAG: MoaD/ThiS family protein [Candidatus Helarchaeota archaeon]
MKIIVATHGRFMNKFLKKDLNIRLKNGSTVKDLLKKVEKRVGLSLIHMLTSNEGSPVILLNGNRIELPEELQKHLKDGDEIHILRSLGGG